MSDWQVEPLDRAHERSAFACGKPPLDDFIRLLVNQYQKRNLGRTYVAVRAGEKTVRGYYTLASGAMPVAVLPASAARKLPKHPVPVILLGRLAVDRSAQGQRLGEGLLGDALRRCAELAERLGVHAVEVNAIDNQAKAFYAKYGFIPLADHELHLYVPIDSILGGLPRGGR
jgi:GNAT superfamily N-acetyltransferase